MELHGLFSLTNATLIGARSGKTSPLSLLSYNERFIGQQYMFVGLLLEVGNG